LVFKSSQLMMWPIHWLMRDGRQGLSIVSSFALVALAAWAGLSTLPLEILTRPDAVQRYQTQAHLGEWRGRQAPVFVFEENLFPHQCGRAWITADQSVALSSYDSCSGRLNQVTTVRLYPANVQFLWSLIPESERDVLEAQAWMLGEQAVSPLLTVLDSAYFREAYGVELRTIFRDALIRTWETPAVQVALKQAVQAVDPATINRLVNNLWPVAVEKTESGVWDSLRRMTDSLLANGGSEASDSSLTGRILEELLKDPRSLAYLFDMLLEVTHQPEVVIFTTLFVREISATLIADPRWSALFDRAMMDPQWASISPETTLNVDFLTRELPRSLLRYRYPKDHNPLVAYLVRSIIRRHDAFVVVMLTDAQVQSAAAQGMRSGILLTAEQP